MRRTWIEGRRRRRPEGGGPVADGGPADPGRVAAASVAGVAVCSGHQTGQIVALVAEVVVTVPGSGGSCRWRWGTQGGRMRRRMRMRMRARMFSR